MTRSILPFCALTWLFAMHAQPTPMTNQMVIEMLEKGMDREFIVNAVRTAPSTDFTFFVQDYAEFQRVKIGPEILLAMSDRAKQQPQLQPGQTRRPQTAPPATRRETTTSAPAPPSVARPAGYLRAGINEFDINGLVTVPHATASGTLASVTLAYQRYLTPRFSIGPSASALFFTTNVHQINALVAAQFSQPIGDRAYFVFGGGPGLASTRIIRSSTHFTAQAYAGPRIFVNEHVAFDLRYQLGYTHFKDSSFKYSTSSSLTAGFSLFF